MSILSILTRLFRRDNGEDEEEGAEQMSPTPTTRVVIGLGNPGKQYANTRHNMGFFVVDELGRRVAAPPSRKRLRAEISEASRDGARLILAMPQTFMNDSGGSVREIRGWYKVTTEQLLVIVDDLDLPFGQVRLRARGSAGGHNGLKSIFNMLGTQEISRLRVGIGRGGHTAHAHVLSRFSPAEQTELEDIVRHAADIAELWLDRGVIEAMNLANDPARQPSKGISAELATRSPQ